MGAETTNLPAIPGDGLPANPSEMDGWTADELVQWIERVAPTAVRYRLGIGLALCRLRDATPEGDYGRHEARLAAAVGVDERTLGRWRAAAETKWPELQPAKAAKRAGAQRGRRGSEKGLVTGRHKSKSGAVETKATELIGPTPDGGMPLPKSDSGPEPWSREGEVDRGFEEFFSADPAVVALRSSRAIGKTRVSMARRWVDRYEMAVKGVTPYAPVPSEPVAEGSIDGCAHPKESRNTLAYGTFCKLCGALIR